MEAWGLDFISIRVINLSNNCRHRKFMSTLQNVRFSMRLQENKTFHMKRLRAPTLRLLAKFNF